MTGWVKQTEHSGAVDQGKTQMMVRLINDVVNNATNVYFYIYFIL